MEITVSPTEATCRIFQQHAQMMWLRAYQYVYNKPITANEIAISRAYRHLRNQQRKHAETAYPTQDEFFSLLKAPTIQIAHEPRGSRKLERAQQFGMIALVPDTYPPEYAMRGEAFNKDREVAEYEKLICKVLLEQINNPSDPHAGRNITGLPRAIYFNSVIDPYPDA